MRILIFSLTMWSCILLAGSAKRSSAPSPSPSPTVVTPLPSPSGTHKITFKPKPGYATTAQKEMIARAEIAANKTIQSQCFRDFLVKQTMNNTGGRTPAEVVDHLQSLSGEILVVMYYRSMVFTSAVASAHVGGMKTSSGVVHQVKLNSAAFSTKGTACRWAATLGGHEGVGHSMGSYGHSSGWTRFREDTVPYLLSGRKAQYGGDVFTACCTE